MNVVSLTFPGHFFQTALSLKSIQRWYDVDKHYVIVDDYEKGPWENYFQDACNYYGTDFIFIPTSSIPHLKNTLNGWWRQQLVKLTLDDLLPDEDWLVVDGDVIFETFCPYRDVVLVAAHPIDFNGTVETLTRNYVQSLLNVEHGHLTHNGKYCMTNPVPYRYLTRDLLTRLKKHVETRFDCDFVDQHIKWFRDQTIVGFHEDMSKWSMSEWELIEIFRRQILKEDLPNFAIGAGYHLDVDLSNIKKSTPIFRHGYVRDTQIEKQWFVDQGLAVSDHLWKESRSWLEFKEPWRA